MKSICLLAVVAACHGATYYVDCAAGSDTNGGVAANVAWKTIEKVNTSRFRPGDRILLKSGCSWSGQLAPRSSGAEGAPIVVGRYGKGALPRVDGGGKVEDALRLYNVEFIEVHDLELTNQGAEPAVRRGVHVFLDNFGTGRHIVVSRLYIHDVNGTNQRKDNGGIIFAPSETPSRADSTA